MSRASGTFTPGRTSRSIHIKLCTSSSQKSKLISFQHRRQSSQIQEAQSPRKPIAGLLFPFSTRQLRIALSREISPKPSPRPPHLRISSLCLHPAILPHSAYHTPAPRFQAQHHWSCLIMVAPPSMEAANKMKTTTRQAL